MVSAHATAVETGHRNYCKACYNAARRERERAAREASPNAEGELKRCSKCKTMLPRSEFNRDAATKDGLQHQCRACHRVTYPDMPLRTYAADRHCETCGTRLSRYNPGPCCYHCEEAADDLRISRELAAMTGGLDACDEEGVIVVPHGRREGWLDWVAAVYEFVDSGWRTAVVRTPYPVDARFTRNHIGDPIRTHALPIRATLRKGTVTLERLV